MAKFNTTNTNKTENRNGHIAYAMSNKEQLMTAVLSTMFGEEKYYGSTDDDIISLATKICKREPIFVSNLACYARNEFNMRSVSHVLTSVVAREAAEYTRRTVHGVVRRADDITEIMACYVSMYGKPFPNALKKAIAEEIQRFDEYQIAKYNGGKKAIKFRDVLRITHPNPKTKEVEALFGKILSDQLETPYTWETELSARGNTKEVWEGIIGTVTKRRIVDKYAPLMKERGYKVLIIDFVHPDQGNAAYDPLDFIGSFADITFVARSIIMANPKKEKSTADPYWDEAAVSLLTALISYVLMTKGNADFGDVLNMIDQLTFEESCGQIRTNYDEKFEYLESRDPSNFSVTNWKSFKRLPIKTASCVFGVLNTTVDSAFSPELRKMFSMRKKVDFERLAAERTCLFVISSPVNPSLNCFINMFYAHAFKQLFEYGEEQPDGKLPIPVHLLADDFATGCPIPLFDQYISIFREKQISVTLLCQNEAQIISLYGSDAANTVITNCDSYVFMGCNDLTTAQNISLRANKPLSTILNLKPGNQILFRRGMKPGIGKRFNIMENETYKAVSRQYEKRVAAEKRKMQERRGLTAGEQRKTQKRRDLLFDGNYSDRRRSKTSSGIYQKHFVKITDSCEPEIPGELETTLDKLMGQIFDD